jgi:hypothetical protein
MEDDARLKGDWSKEWLKVQGKLPSEWECVYLGGVLPPNREGFNNVLEKTDVPGLCRIAPNTFFGQSVPSRQFHFCAYAYVLSRRGARRIMNAIEQHDGIWTSADHVLFNSLNKENVFVLNPLVAGASQDNDPVYVNSDFNDFSRIDKFDSDLWNNDERFSLENVHIPASKLDIRKTINDIYLGKPSVTSSMTSSMTSSVTSSVTSSIYKVVVLDVCNVTTETIYEAPWLKELMGSFTIDVVSKNTDLSTYTNLVIVVIRDKWSEQIEWITRLCNAGKKIKILHFSDEYENDPFWFYDRAEILSVMRFYKRSDIHNKKVLNIPLGYHWKNNYNITPIDTRKYIWSFHGTNWKNRSGQLEPFLELEPSNVKYYNQWRSPSQLNEDDYIKLLLDTVFVPCPSGNNIETFRFYEVLECGCIPIFTELPKVLEGTNIPFLRISSWDEGKDLIKHFMKNKVLLIQYQKSLLDGWNLYKATLKDTIKEWLKLV